MRILSACLLCAVLLAAAWYLLAAPAQESGASQGDPVTDRVTEQKRIRKPSASEVASARVLPAPAPLPRVENELGHVRLPTGEYLPNLNGVKSKAQLRWGDGPFPKVSHKIVDAKGYEWYVMENGDTMTTVTEPGTDARGNHVMRDLIIYDQHVAPLPTVDPGELIPVDPKQK